MEPIFKDSLFNSNNGVVQDCVIFKKSSELFFEIPKNRTLENSFFHFGLIFDSSHYLKNDNWEGIFKPIKALYRGIISPEEIVSIQLGKTSNNEYDEAEADKHDPYYWRITKAIEYKRPDWALYMFAGNVQGLFNGNRISEDRLLQYLRLFPEEFISIHKERLQYAFNYFDERGYLLALDKAPKLIKIGKGLYDEILAVGVN
ncbi:MAG TPA: hypothetical protein PLZ12_12785 [Saprospiraceae bacterium]|nr:hypothetical protein [Saprospiraceae bacterium]